MPSQGSTQQVKKKKGTSAAFIQRLVSATSEPFVPRTLRMEKQRGEEVGRKARLGLILRSVARGRRRQRESERGSCELAGSTAIQLRERGERECVRAGGGGCAVFRVLSSVA